MHRAVKSTQTDRGRVKLLSAAVLFNGIKESWRLARKILSQLKLLWFLNVFDNTLLAILHLEIALNLFAAGSAEQLNSPRSVVSLTLLRRMERGFYMPCCAFLHQAMRSSSGTAFDCEDSRSKKSTTSYSSRSLTRRWSWLCIGRWVTRNSGAMKPSVLLTPKVCCSLTLHFTLRSWLCVKYKASEKNVLEPSTSRGHAVDVRML